MRAYVSVVMQRGLRRDTNDSSETAERGAHGARFARSARQRDDLNGRIQVHPLHEACGGYDLTKPCAVHGT